MKKKVKNIPEVTHDVYVDMEMLLSQAEMTTNAARNTVDDLYRVASEFINSLANETTRDYVFWKIVDEYIYKKYNRPNHLRYLISNLEPKYLLVYQLLLDGEIIYVGKTNNIHNRLVAHSKDKLFDKVLLAKCEDEVNQSALESTLIEIIRPPLNRSLNLQQIDSNIVIPEFTDSLEFQLDFITPTRFPLGLVPKNHVWLGNGFASLDKLKNKPYWHEKK